MFFNYIIKYFSKSRFNLNKFGYTIEISFFFTPIVLFDIESQSLS